MSVSGKAFDWQLFKRVMAYAKPYKARFWFTLFLTILHAALGTVRPLIILFMIDEFIPAGDLDGLIYWSVLMVGVLLVEAVIEFYQTYLANWLGQSIILDLRVKLYKHILSLQMRYFDRTPLGALVTRAVADIETISEVFSQGILIIIGDILKLVVVVTIMLVLNWQMALLVLTPVPILLVATSIFKKAIKSAFQDVRTQVSKLNTFVQEHLTGMAVVQIFGREKVEYDHFQAINKKHRTAHIKSVWAYSVFFPVVEILSAMSIAVLVLWGLHEVGTDINQDARFFGELFAFIFYIHMLYRPIRQLADRFNILQMGMVGSDRVFKVLDTRDHIADTGTELLEDVKGSIEFRDVRFAYIEAEPVLKGVSFKVEAGETLAIVGATGAGKSSIINLLSRFYDFEGGQIFIDGVNIRDVQLDAMRENIAVVLQDVFLFSDSILNNITLRDPGITQEEVIAASKAVGAHDFIMRMPGGYEYNVRERGSTLSVGQRQLIAFIRAYVFKPKILVLDEATSSVDTESEIMIQRAIEKLTEKQTSIVIAHRLSTVQRADKILVLDHGKVLEIGTHQELLANNGQYKKLFELQFSA